MFEKYGISKESLTGNKRNKDIANTRHITIYLIRELTEMSFPSIAKIFGRDHSTIISSHRLVEFKMLDDPAFLTEINELKKEI
jgi:chromosomal replication initiator protein